MLVAIAVRTDLPNNVMLLPMRLRNRNIKMIDRFPTEFIYRNSYFSLRILKHQSQRLVNLFKINLVSVYRSSVQSAKAPVCNKLFCEHVFHENWFIHLTIYSKTKQVLLAYFNGAVLQYVYLSRLRLALIRMQTFKRNRICFLCRYLSNHRSMFTKLLEKWERKNLQQDTLSLSLLKTRRRMQLGKTSIPWVDDRF